MTLTVDKDIHRVEVTFIVNGIFFRAEESSDDMYVSVDLVSDKLQHQIQRYKDRLNQNFRDRGTRTRIVASGDGNLDTIDDLQSELDGDAKVVRTKQFAVKPMDIEEAILQMELLGHDFFVFRDSKSNDVNVLYRRKDGRYGLIDPR